MPANQRPSTGSSSSGKATPPRARRPTSQDLERARQDALIQLKIGRSAHYYSVGVSVALLVDAILVLLVRPGVRPATPEALASLFPALFPLLAGLFLSAVAVKLKWEANRFSFSEAHFLVSWGALVLDAVLTFLVLARLAHFGPTGHWTLLPAIYPLALLAVAAPLVSLALTWSDWSQRKVGAVASAVVPVPIALSLFVPAVMAAASSEITALTTTLLVGAVLFQTSGSFLHLISSGTAVHEREVISGGQGHLQALAEDLQQKEEALLFREQTLIQREADVDSAEAELHDRTRTFEQDRSALDAQLTDLDHRTAEVTQREQTVQITGARVETTRQTLEEREAAVAAKEQQVGTRHESVSGRESAIGQREMDAGRRDLELKALGDELDRKQADLRLLADRLAARETQIEQKTGELLQLEGDLRGRAGLATVSNAGKDALSRKSADVARKEVEVAQLRVRLDEERKTLEERASQLAVAFDDAKKAREELNRREQAVLGREQVVRQREADAAAKQESAAQLTTQYEAAVRRAEDRLKEVNEREAKFGTQVSEVDRIGHVLSTRETTVKERERQLGQLREEFARRERDLTQRERSLEARESQLSVQSLELDRRASVGRTLAPGSGAGDADYLERQKVLDLRERQLREREQAVVRQRAELTSDSAAAAGTLAPPTVQRQKDRLPSGTARLDDLLAGGLPPKAHVLLVGPAFTGKEVLLYSFIAEGLRRGEPAILVTTSRSPEETAGDIGKVTAQFKEYEQLGLVTWIDASNPDAAPGATPADDHRTVVKGPSDQAGILTALVRAAQRAEASKSGAFRVGFLSLSTSLAHTDEKEAFAFFQNFVGILKARPALALYLVDQGTVPEARIEVAQSRLDGAIHFKQERGRSYLSVQGLGDVQTRDWVEYRATNRQLVIGSFALERIR